ncbi:MULTISPECIES: hypothetical protein [Pseudomonadati]|uniref:Uncharacterized protein n=1 Tax=Shewanella aestuarii TaxID=1028752 RepID=A0ABT0L3B3_9GAMM|nr:hypothetical protein [Shewanella aestuarii]MCL1118198.1 hypothetical protein [Shewanella aestuarii]GGN81350.1 hypothetical protein GCM10009193_27450 [Shewanella aestuarii]
MQKLKSQLLNIALPCSVLFSMFLFMSGCDNSLSHPEMAEEQVRQKIVINCSEVWYQQVEKQLLSGDGQGHGPDLGSDEWQSVIEFKLGIRGDKTVPQRNTDAWCTFIDERLQH